MYHLIEREFSYYTVLLPTTSKTLPVVITAGITLHYMLVIEGITLHYLHFTTELQNFLYGSKICLDLCLKVMFKN